MVKLHAGSPAARISFHRVEEPNLRVTTLLFSGLATTFVKEFLFGLWLTLPLLLVLAAIVALLGQVVGRKEGWSRFDGLYWSFITATTVGYGDLRTVKKCRGSSLS